MTLNLTTDAAIAYMTSSLASLTSTVNVNAGSITSVALALASTNTAMVSANSATTVAIGASINTALAARSLGTMSVQAASSVAITGGTAVLSSLTVVGTFTVATLPKGVPNGTIVYCSNARIGLQVVGSGTGSLVMMTAIGWVTMASSATVVTA